MSNKKKPKYVSEARLSSLLSRWAKAADAAFSVKIAEMEDRLRQEFTVVVPPKHDASFKPCSECDRPSVCAIVLAGTQPCVHPDRRPECACGMAHDGPCLSLEEMASEALAEHARGETVPMDAFLATHGTIDTSTMRAEVYELPEDER